MGVRRRFHATPFALTAIVAAAVMTAYPARALPPGETGPSTVLLTGLAGDGATLYGRFRPDHFTGSPAGMSVDGVLTGTLTRTGAVQTHFTQPLVLPVDRGQSDGTCQFINIALGPRDVGVAGDGVHIDQMVFNVSWAQGPGSRLDVPLCQAELLLRGAPADTNAGLAGVLNQMLSLLGQGG